MPSSNTTQSEDCLYMNVVRPEGTQANASLPVVVWIYGGAFETGDASAYNGVPVVQRSNALGSDVIYVSFNYRVNAFGFLAGKEIKEAGVANLGLHDQRLALQWVQDNIAAFGGDPSRVVAWGQSAGAISIWMQMLANDGQLNGLFSGAVTQSGFTEAFHDISEQQPVYDQIVSLTNCTNPPQGNTTLDCIRAVDYQTLVNAVNQVPPLLSYQSLDTSFRPTIDGDLFTRTLRDSMNGDLYAKVPIIGGDVDDEGTLFSLLNANVTTDQDFLSYVQTNYMPQANETQMEVLGDAYSSEPDLGSPFNTGTNNTLTPQYKRISAVQGDLYFQMPRRFALTIASKTQKVWSYLYRANKYSALGTFHESDLQEFYELTESPSFVGTDMLVNFAYNLDPNVPAGGYKGSPQPASGLVNVTWPTYNSNENGTLLTFEPEGQLNFTQDNYRQKEFILLNELSDAFGW
ncbi:sterol esterase [Coniophora puteana RWD-64-598 SS2]|uniref:Sterol esterase n=1 Tax=Coniophora puteana (strain RWD-64-598) TaxID=741705 RepID=A0A5M3MN73_CONPW|nr:sterol esterase [Coniophora puteana RWD-64-598 SS2]EIW80165.1 sterol esterase [Coniophora puteana RWD-64-598 SS2]